MTIFTWLIFIALFLLSLYIIIVNWITIFSNYSKTSKKPSNIVLLGGILICIAFLISPINQLKSFWWLGFVIDYGSLPIFIHTVYFYIRIGRFR